MEESIEERIEFYFRIYERIYQRISRSNLENAKDVALKVFEEVAKDLRAEQFNRSRAKGGKAGEKPATEKQREALQKFGVKKVPENLSMREASKALNILINLSKEKDRTAIEKAVEELNQNWV
jgi:hypothetical protein